MTAVSDQIYLYLSEDAYRLKYDKVPLNIRYIVNGETEEWTIVTDKEWITHDPRTGFDAFVVKRGGELVVAFRGTQGDDLLGEGYADVITDIEYIVRKKPVHQEYPNPRCDRYDLYYDREKGTWYKPNQFQQAEKLVKDIKQKYPEANITTTGHSLGGATAQYSAAIFGLSAVTYSAPTVIDLLPEGIRKKAENGDFDSSIVNYVHPKACFIVGKTGNQRKLLNRQPLLSLMTFQGIFRCLRIASMIFSKRKKFEPYDKG